MNRFSVKNNDFTFTFGAARGHVGFSIGTPALPNVVEVPAKKNIITSKISEKTELLDYDATSYILPLSINYATVIPISMEIFPSCKGAKYSPNCFPNTLKKPHLFSTSPDAQFRVFVCCHKRELDAPNIRAANKLCPQT